MTGRRKKALPLPPRMYVYHAKRHDTYYTITPLNERINLGHDLLEAKRKLLELEEGRSIAGTIGELLDDFQAERKLLVARGELTQRTYDDNEEYIKELKKAFRRVSPRSLERHHVWKYLHKYRGRKAPVRANKEVSFLHSAFEYACDAGIVKVNPVTGVAKNKETPRDRLVTDAELAKFCSFARANGHLRDNSPMKQYSDAGLRVALALELAYLTGKAQHQVLRLHKTQVEDEGIQFDRRKKGRSHNGLIAFANASLKSKRCRRKSRACISSRTATGNPISAQVSAR